MEIAHTIGPCQHCHACVRARGRMIGWVSWRQSGLLKTAPMTGQRLRLLKASKVQRASIERLMTAEIARTEQAVVFGRPPPLARHSCCCAAAATGSCRHVVAPPPLSPPPDILSQCSMIELYLVQMGQQWDGWDMKMVVYILLCIS